MRVACCSFCTVSGLKRCSSPSRRQRYSPPDSRSPSAGRRAGKARSWRCLTSSRDDVDADAADARRRPREVAVDEALLEADGLENLRAAVALQGRNAHLGHHFEDALVERLDVVERRLLARHALDHALRDHVVEGLEREVRVHRPGAVADEERDVMHFARVARLEEERAAGARAFAHEVVVDTSRRQQARDRRALLGHAPVRQDQDRVAFPHGGARLRLQPLHRPFERGTALARVVDHRQRDRAEPVEVRRGPGYAAAWPAGRCR